MGGLADRQADDPDRARRVIGFCRADAIRNDWFDTPRGVLERGGSRGLRELP